MKEIAKVNRVEVIDWVSLDEEGGGRAYVYWKEKASVCYDVQDDGKTLKIFIKKLKESNG